MDALAGYGEGFMDPDSDMSKRWMEQLRENVGESTDAAQRAAGYQAAQQGFGGGASPELLAMQRDIGVGGREAEGQAASDFALRGPTPGVQALGWAAGFETAQRGQDIGAATTQRGQDLQSRMAEMGGQQFQQQFQQQGAQTQQQLQLQYDQLAQDQYLRELMMQYGG